MTKDQRPTITHEEDHAEENHLQENEDVPYCPPCEGWVNPHTHNFGVDEEDPSDNDQTAENPEVPVGREAAPQGDPPEQDPPQDIPEADPPADPEPAIVHESAISQARNKLQDLGIEKPTKKQVNSIVPLFEIKEQVAHASTAVKKTIMKRRAGGVEKRHAQKTTISRAISLSRNSVFPVNPQSPKKITTRRRMAEAKVAAVDEFLRRLDNGYVLPDKKYYRKDRGEFIPVVALVDNLRNLHRKFVIETGLTMSFSTFCKAWDKRTINTSVFLKRSVCLCKPHANMSMMLEVVPGLPNSTTELTALTDEEVQAGLDTLTNHQIVRFKRWVKESRPYGSPEEERTVYHTELRKVRISAEQFKEQFLQDLPDFREHHRRVSEQYAAVRLLKSIVPEDHAICHMDYAENWATSFMHEIQYAFYGKDQVTLHPMVVYNRQGETLHHKCFVGVTSVTNHSFPTTLAFLNLLLVQIKVAVPDLKHLHLVTDSPSSQYRNRFSCEMLRKATTTFGIRITWNWLEAGHGKGPCDGVGGALKGLADRVVKACGAIQTADEFVEHVQPQTQKITLLRTSATSIKECNELVDSWSSRKVNNITKYHQATVHENQLYLRPTSCYQECCMVDDDLRPMCEPWIKANSRPVPKPRAARATTTNAPARRRRAAAAHDVHSDSDSDSEVEDEVGANEAALLEQPFSSDEEVTEVAESVHRTRRVADRVKRRMTRTARSGKALATATVAAATAESEAEPESDVEDDGSDNDPDYTPEPETPEESARTAAINARHTAIARRRRRGQIVNEVVEDGDTSSDDWPVFDTMSIASRMRAGF